MEFVYGAACRCRFVDSPGNALHLPLSGLLLLVAANRLPLPKRAKRVEDGLHVLRVVGSRNS